MAFGHGLMASCGAFFCSRPPQCHCGLGELESFALFGVFSISTGLNFLTGIATFSILTYRNHLAILCFIFIIHPIEVGAESNLWVKLARNSTALIKTIGTVISCLHLLREPPSALVVNWAIIIVGALCIKSSIE